MKHQHVAFSLSYNSFIQHVTQHVKIPELRYECHKQLVDKEYELIARFCSLIYHFTRKQLPTFIPQGFLVLTCNPDFDLQYVPGHALPDISSTAATGF